MSEVVKNACRDSNGVYLAYHPVVGTQATMLSKLAGGSDV